MLLVQARYLWKDAVHRTLFKSNLHEEDAHVLSLRTVGNS